MSNESAQMQEQGIVGVAMEQHTPIKWRCQYRIEKYAGDPVGYDRNGKALFDMEPYEVLEGEGNKLTTAGANTLFTALTGGGITAFNAANSQIVVGSGTGTPAVGDADMFVAAGATVTITAATNATPIQITATAHGLSTGQTVVVAAVGGNTAANGTWEVTVVDVNNVTLNTSVGNGAYTSGGTIAPISKYRMLVSGAPTVTTNQVQFSSVFGNNNANFQWNEWGVTTGGAATNKQATPPPMLLNHAGSGGGLNLGTKASGSWTFNVTLSLA